MPKAKASSKKPTPAKPYSKPKQITPVKDASSKSKSRTGKDSHLYTDDNPATTLHGTGFTNAEKAEQTIQLVSKRSLTYQFQVMNTMYHRAKHHRSSSSNANIQAAITVFGKWLDETYPAAKQEEPYRRLLAKDIVEKCLPLLKERVSEDDLTWAEKYVKLEKGKRLANTLMDDSKPGEADMEAVRQDVLKKLVGNGKGKALNEELWGFPATGLTSKHARCLAHAIPCCSVPELIRHVESLLEQLESKK